MKRFIPGCRSFLSVCLLALLPACTTSNRPQGAGDVDDLRLERVEWVERYDISTFRIGSSGSGVEARNELQPGFLVRFSTKQDLAALTARGNPEKSNYLSTDVSVCSGTKYDRDRELRAGGLSGEQGDFQGLVGPRPNLSPGPDGRYLYKYFLYPRTDDVIRHFNRHAVPHDLLRDRGDVCFRLIGPTGYFTRLTSNTVVVPEAAIQAAIAARASP